jgi:hypothetical protein
MTKLVNTFPSVPKLSVHWSVPWPREWKFSKTVLTPGQWRYLGYSKLGFDYDEHGGIAPDLRSRLWNEPDWKGARKIRFKNNDIRIFPHEFNPLSTDVMRTLINGSVLLLHKQSSTASEEPITTELEGEARVIYEEALVAGCDHAQAMMVAHGIDPTIPDAEFPPIGWYSCVPEYARHFCEDWEMDVVPKKTKSKKRRR